VLLALEFVIGATNGRERDELPSLCGLRVSVCCFVVGSCCACGLEKGSPEGYQPFPFIGQGKGGWYMENDREKGKEEREKHVRRRPH
jgi:hypothetical protein